MKKENGDNTDKGELTERFEDIEYLIRLLPDSKKRERKLLALEYLKRAAFRLPPREKLAPCAMTVNDNSGALIIYKHYQEVVEALLINGFLKYLKPEGTDPAKYAQSMLGISIDQEEKDSLRQEAPDLWLVGFVHDMQICVTDAMGRVFPKIAEIFQVVIDQACDEVIAETLNARYHLLCFQDQINTKQLFADVQKRAADGQKVRLKTGGGPPKGRGKITSRVQLLIYVKAAILDCRRRGIEPIEQKDVISFLNKINGKDFCKSVRQFTGWLAMFNLKWTKLLEEYSNIPLVNDKSGTGE